MPQNASQYAVELTLSTGGVDKGIDEATRLIFDALDDVEVEQQKHAKEVEAIRKKTLAETAKSLKEEFALIKKNLDKELAEEGLAEDKKIEIKEKYLQDYDKLVKKSTKTQKALNKLVGESFEDTVDKEVEAAKAAAKEKERVAKKALAISETQQKDFFDDIEKMRDNSVDERKKEINRELKILQVGLEEELDAVKDNEKEKLGIRRKYLKKFDKLQSEKKGLGGDEKAVAEKPAKKGAFAAISGVLGSIPPQAAAASAAILGVGKAAFEAAQNFDQFQASVNRIGSIANLSTEETERLGASLRGIERPANVTKEVMMEMAASVATFEKSTTDIKNTTEQITKLIAKYPDANPEEVMSGFKRLTQQLGSSDKAIVALSSSAEMLQGTSLDPLGEAATEVATVFTKARATITDTGNAMSQAQMLFNAFIGSSFEVSESTSTAEIIFEQLNSTLQDVEQRTELSKVLDGLGLSMADVGLEAGKLDLIKLTDFMMSGEEGVDDFKVALGGVTTDLELVTSSFVANGTSMADYVVDMTASTAKIEDIRTPMQKAQAQILQGWDDLWYNMGASTQSGVGSIMQVAADSLSSVASIFEPAEVTFEKAIEKAREWSDIADDLGTVDTLDQVAAKLDSIRAVSEFDAARIQDILDNDSIGTEAQLRAVNEQLAIIQDTAGIQATAAAITASQAAAEKLGDTLYEAYGTAGGFDTPELWSQLFDNSLDSLDRMIDRESEISDILKTQELGEYERRNLLNERRELTLSIAEEEQKIGTVQDATTMAIQDTVESLRLQNDGLLEGIDHATVKAELERQYGDSLGYSEALLSQIEKQTNAILLESQAVNAEKELENITTTEAIELKRQEAVEEINRIEAMRAGVGIAAEVMDIDTSLLDTQYDLQTAYLEQLELKEQQVLSSEQIKVAAYAEYRAQNDINDSIKLTAQQKEEALQASLTQLKADKAGLDAQITEYEAIVAGETMVIDLKNKSIEAQNNLNKAMGVTAAGEQVSVGEAEKELAALRAKSAQAGEAIKGIQADLMTVGKESKIEQDIEAAAAEKKRKEDEKAAKARAKAIEKEKKARKKAADAAERDRKKKDNELKKQREKAAKEKERKQKEEAKKSEQLSKAKDKAQAEAIEAMHKEAEARRKSQQDMIEAARKYAKELQSMVSNAITQSFNYISKYLQPYINDVKRTALEYNEMVESQTEQVDELIDKRKDLIKKRDEIIEKGTSRTGTLESFENLINQNIKRLADAMNVSAKDVRGAIKKRAGGELGITGLSVLEKKVKGSLSSEDLKAVNQISQSLFMHIQGYNKELEKAKEKSKEYKKITLEIKQANEAINALSKLLLPSLTNNVAKVALYNDSLAKIRAVQSEITSTVDKDELSFLERKKELLEKDHKLLQAKLGIKASTLQKTIEEIKATRAELKASGQLKDATAEQLEFISSIDNLLLAVTRNQKVVNENYGEQNTIIEANLKTLGLENELIKLRSGDYEKEVDFLKEKLRIEKELLIAKKSALGIAETQLAEDFIRVETAVKEYKVGDITKQEVETVEAEYKKQLEIVLSLRADKTSIDDAIADINKQLDEMLDSASKKTGELFKAAVDELGNFDDSLEESLEAMLKFFKKGENDVSEFTAALDKLKSDDLDEQIEGLAMLTAALENAGEVAVGTVKKVASLADAFKEGDAAAAIGGTGDLMQLVGKALLIGPPPLNLVGAILILGGSITKLISNAIAPKRSAVDIAKEQAINEQMILDMYNAELETLETLVALGEDRVDSAREQYEYQKATHDLLLEDSEEQREMSKLSNEDLANREEELKLRQAQNQAALDAASIYASANAAGKKAYLESIGSEDVNIFNANRWYQDRVNDLTAENTLIETRLEMIGVEKEYRIDEIEYAKERISLLRQEYELQGEIALFLNDYAAAAANAAANINTLVTEQLAPILLSNLPEWTDEIQTAIDTLDYEALLDFIPLLDQSLISTDDIKILEEYFSAIKEYGNSIFEQEQRRHNLKQQRFEAAMNALISRSRMEGKTEEEIAKLEERRDEGRLAYMQDQLAALDEEFSRLAEIGVASDRLIELQIERFELETSINDLLAEETDQTDEQSRRLAQLIRQRQELYELQQAGQASEADVLSATQQIRQELEAQGWGQQEVEALLESLPEYVSGSTIAGVTDSETAAAVETATEPAQQTQIANTNLLEQSVSTEKLMLSELRKISERFNVDKLSRDLRDWVKFGQSDLFDMARESFDSTDNQLLQNMQQLDSPVLQGLTQSLTQSNQSVNITINMDQKNAITNNNAQAQNAGITPMSQQGLVDAVNRAISTGQINTRLRE